MAAPQGSWTILALVRWATDYFATKAVAEPRASAEVLLAHVLGLTRLDLYLRYDQPLAPPELAAFKSLVVRRRHGEPVPYLTGHKEFWSRDFLVTPAVLIPRPETEVLVAVAIEAAKELGENEVGQGKQELVDPAPKENSPHTAPPIPYRGLEVGVGSGAVVVSLAKELPQSGWVAVDLSYAALLVAWENARRHEVAGRIDFIQGDLLDTLRVDRRFNLLVANLPYVPEGEWRELPRDIRDYEPKTALMGGADGLDLVRALVREAAQHLAPRGWLALEIGAGQAEAVVSLIAGTEAFEAAAAIADYQSIPRVVRARRRPD